MFGYMVGHTFAVVVGSGTRAAESSDCLLDLFWCFLTCFGVVEAPGRLGVGCAVATPPPSNKRAREAPPPALPRAGAVQRPQRVPAGFERFFRLAILPLFLAGCRRLCVVICSWRLCCSICANKHALECAGERAACGELGGRG